MRLFFWPLLICHTYHLSNQDVLEDEIMKDTWIHTYKDSPQNNALREECFINVSQCSKLGTITTDSKGPVRERHVVL